MKRIAIILALLPFLMNTAYAHATAVYVSTPVSPPSNFEWVYYTFLFVLIAVNVRLYWRMKDRHSKLLLALSGLFFFIYAFVFYFIGRLAATSTTAPPPGLGPPHWPLWGLGWDAVGALFVRWNIYGILILVVMSIAASFILRLKSRRSMLIIALANILVYTLFLTPYIFTGALTHGWCSTYTHDRCRRHITQLAEGIIEYQRHNKGRMPDARTMAELYVKVKPYLGHLYERDYHTKYPIYYCPVGSTFEHDFPPFVWNNRLSGCTTEELAQLPQYEIAILCTWHNDRHFLVTRALLEANRRGGKLYPNEWLDLFFASMISAEWTDSGWEPLESWWEKKP